jgi:acyl-CoA thioesterase-1
MMPSLDRGFLIIVLLVGSVACGSGGDTGRRTEIQGEPAPTTAEAPAPSLAAAPAADPRPKVVVLGDSLTAGLGLAQSEAYPVLLQTRIDEEGMKYQVVNAGVSGDTSAGGLSRLDWALDGDVRVLIVALGANDGLRGLPPAELTRNLATIIERAQARKIRVVLAGMEAPPNFGEAYTVSFHRVYPDLASRYHLPLVPFLLDRVAGIERLNQADGIHPTPEGARLVADNVWTVLRPVLKGS